MIEAPEPFFAMLTTPTSQLRELGSEQLRPGHRSFVPLLTVEELTGSEILTSAQVDQADEFDSLLNYMYLPAMPGFFPRSLAYLQFQFPFNDDEMNERITQRVAQLTEVGAQQLQRKLVAYFSSLLWPRSEFSPPLD